MSEGEVAPMTGGGESAAPDTSPSPAPEAPDTSTSGTGGGEGAAAPQASSTPSSEAEATGQAAAPDDGVQRFRIGDEELTVEEMQARLSPDYEHAIKAGGEETKIRNAELRRYLELGAGAHKRMQEAAEVRKQFTDRMERMRGGQIGDVLAEILDPAKYPDGAQSWAREQLREEFEQQQRLEQLYKTDPVAHRREVERIATERALAKANFETKRKEAQAAQEAKQRAHQEMVAKVPGALEAAGLPTTPGAYAHFARTMQQYQQVGHDLSPEDAAHLAAKEFRGEVSTFLQQALASGGPKAVLDMLGPDMRKAFREFELQDGKGKAAPKPKASTESAPAPKKDGKRPWGTTMRDELRAIDRKLRSA